MKTNTVLKSEPTNNVNYDNFPEMEAEEFTPGCCGGPTKGVVYESHEKNQAFC